VRGMVPAYGDDQRELAASVRRYVERHVGDDVARAEVHEMPTPWWKGLAELGVLALGTDGAGGALDVAAVCEELGRGGVPGPFAATFVAAQLLEPDDRAAVIDGAAVVAVGELPLVPWSPVASQVIELDGSAAWFGDVQGVVEEVATTAGEPWGRVTLDRRRQLEGVERALALGDIALAAYLVGLGGRLLDVAVGYARDRKQFGRTIGEFQGVAHPLADVALGVRAAGALVRIAAAAWDERGARAGADAATARLSATRAALRGAYQCHQVHGAMGFTVEGPVAHLSHRARQVQRHLPVSPLRDRALAVHGI
jgi:alkylation response protein AidB-like acyl-CoA dehydrogenase